MAKVSAKAISTSFIQWSRRFDARPDRLDLRDRLYSPPLRSLPEEYPQPCDVGDLLGGYVKSGLVIDQGTEGACTGYGLACVANYLLWTRHLQSDRGTTFQGVSPRMLYVLARRYDEWPGDDYEGSSCRGAIKGWYKHGVCSEELWPSRGKRVRPKAGWDTDAASRPLGVYYRINRRSIVDIQAAILEIGAVFVSAGAHDGWDALLGTKATTVPTSHGDLPLIGPVKDRRQIGGHAFAFVGYNERGFVVQNSWGRKWGASGFAVLPYDDWLEHSTDAWACALGAPMVSQRGKKARSSHYPLPSGHSLGSWQSRPSGKAVDEPPYGTWSVDQARNCTVVMGNDGAVLNEEIPSSGLDDAATWVDRIVRAIPADVLGKQSGKTVRIALYAHGGLNSESASIARIQSMAPVMAGNGIYPLFFTWKTGPGETLRNIVSDWKRHIAGEDDRSAGAIDRLRNWGDQAAEAVRDRSDRAFEEIARRLGRGIWSEMRENADLAGRRGRGVDLVARSLLDLRDDLAAKGKALEIHLVGHSAGSILLGHLLARWTRTDLLARKPSVASCTLFAAACSVRFACDHYLPADAAKVLSLKDLHLYCLSDENEKRDGLPTEDRRVYGKSLLYLVCRALDDRRKMPILGLERALLPGLLPKGAVYWDKAELGQIATWQGAWNKHHQGWERDTVVRSAEVVVQEDDKGNPLKRSRATHGSFDNDLTVMTKTLERIRGAKLVKRIGRFAF